MSTTVKNKEAEAVLRIILEKEGFVQSRVLKNGETGVDIYAQKNEKKYYIEVIGFKKSAPTRSRDFYEVFFRAISRLKDGADYLIIALPKRY